MTELPRKRKLIAGVGGAATFDLKAALLASESLVQRDAKRARPAGAATSASAQSNAAAPVKLPSGIELLRRTAPLTRATEEDEQPFGPAPPPPEAGEAPEAPSGQSRRLAADANRGVQDRAARDLVAQRADNPTEDDVELALGKKSDLYARILAGDSAGRERTSFLVDFDRKQWDEEDKRASARAAIERRRAERRQMSLVSSDMLREAEREDWEDGFSAGLTLLAPLGCVLLGSDSFHPDAEEEDEKRARIAVVEELHRSVEKERERMRDVKAKRQALADRRLRLAALRQSSQAVAEAPLQTTHDQAPQDPKSPEPSQQEQRPKLDEGDEDAREYIRDLMALRRK
eukprot:TRINITY_DN3967_c0_g1_i2.p1 TRINITY_DN3967_c0_g1~~TRINITY_DN3967_c0_g1_i2.p1  ORF type:complete len:345 (+),score=68.70 TRINITY_DN3967_c0_g1_i2:3-1037(+)